MSEYVVMDAGGMKNTLARLVCEVGERNERPESGVPICIGRGGEIVARRIRGCLLLSEGMSVPCGGIDAGMRRDDMVSAFFAPEGRKSRPLFHFVQGFGALGRHIAHGEQRPRGER